MNPIIRSMKYWLWPGKPKWLRENKEKITEAFVYRGRKYYMFDDIFTLPTIRGLQALDYYDEFTMRCTKEFLTEYCKAVDEILSNPKKLDLVRLATITGYLKERLTMIPVPDHIFKLASVIFFDDSENPYFYDRKYAEKKIAYWKEDPAVLSFFLRTPLKDLIPFLDLQEENLNTYSALVEMLNVKHLSAVLSPSSASDMRPAM